MASSHRDEISRLELLHAAHPEGLVFPHLADAYRRAGRFSQAELVLNAGLRRHADYSSAHVVLGRLRLDQGKRAEARSAFRRVLQLDPQNQVALEYLGELSAESGQLAEALEYFRRLQRFKPDEALEARIEGLRRRLEGRGGGDVGAVAAVGGENGAPSAERGVSSTPHPAEPVAPPEPGEVVTETMAELYARQGLHDRAASVYRELLSRNPGDARLQAKLARLEAQPEPAAAGDAARSPAPASAPGIRSQLRSLLAWRPAAASAPEPPTGPEPRSRPGDPDDPHEPHEPHEPWAGAAVSMVPEPEGPPVAEARPALDSPALDSPTPDSPAPARPVERSPSTGDASSTLIAITDMLVGLLEYRDPFFRGSSSLTRLLATSVAEEMGLPAEERVNLALAAVLRDLGRLALGGRLLPTGKSVQTPDARRRIERHVDLALHLLEGIELPPVVRAAVRHHHERWDGAGYPDALAGEAIPLAARILSVVDSFAAMVSPRSYRVPLKAADAAKELQEEAGTRYDSVVVEALVRVLGPREHPRFGFVQRHHVLLVNPDQPGAVVTAAKLCSVGYLAEVAADVAAAKERLRRIPVAALVVAAGSENEGVAEFIQSLRSDPLFGALPIVAVDAEGVAWRVRLLESGADVCFPPGVSHAELQGTLGALVRRTLKTGGEQQAATAAGSGESPWLALQGDLQDFPLTWLLQVMKYDSRTAAIAIRTDREDGVIYLRQGDAVHAHLRDGAQGEDALRHMLGWRSGRFTVQPDARPRETTIRSSIMHLLLTQAVDEDHESAGIFGAVSAEG